MTVRLSVMSDRGAYDDPDLLQRHLARKLLEGSLCLVLGAGASQGPKGFGLPNWDELTSGLWAHIESDPPAGLQNEMSAERFLIDHCQGDRIELAKILRTVLYAKFSGDLSKLRASDLLAAIGALTMASTRGNVATVVSFNYDDIVELFLSYFGYHCRSIDCAPSWASRADVSVLHPHGLLKSDPACDVERGVVFTQMDYDAVVGNSKDTWRAKLLEVFRSHFCVFVGLSGNDTNLNSLLMETSKEHPSREDGEAFWGVRFSLDKDVRNGHWESRGVYPLLVSDYSNIPPVLFGVCQTAAALRRG